MPSIGAITKRKTNKMENQTPPQEPQVELTPAEEKAIEVFSKTLDLEAAPKNSVLIVKIGTNDHLYANNLQMGIIQRVLNPRVEILRDKRLTVLFMAREDDITLLTEEDMEKAGWVKKEPNRIITT
jgi:hypothetical protein